MASPREDRGGHERAPEVRRSACGADQRPGPVAPQGATAHFSALSCVAGGHRLSRLNHARRWCGAGSPAVHPVWDQH